MNKQIKELAQQAGMYVDLKGKPWPKSMSAEECEAAYKKFAELIVQECQFAIVSRMDLPKHERKLYNNVLKEHFGVAE